MATRKINVDALIKKVTKEVSKSVEVSDKKTNAQIKSFDEISYQNKHIEINETRINNILGTNLSREDYLNYLFNLGFVCSEKIEIPSFRSDIVTQNDLAEEIARAIGYDYIKSCLIYMCFPFKINKLLQSKKKKKKF